MLLAAFSCLQQLLACPAAAPLLLAACPLPALLLALLLEGRVAGEVLEALLVVLAQVPSAVESLGLHHLQRVTQVLRAAAAEDLDTLDAGWYLCAQGVTRLVRGLVTRVTTAAAGSTRGGQTPSSTAGAGGVGGRGSGIVVQGSADMGAACQVVSEVRQQLLPLLRGLVAAPCPPSSAGYQKAIAGAVRSLGRALDASKEQQQGQRRGRGQVVEQLQQVCEEVGGAEGGAGVSGLLQEAVRGLDAALR